MDHKLRVLVRVDIEQSSAWLEVAGCLTGANCKALFPILRRAHALVRGCRIVVDLSRARHVERAGLDLLEQVRTGQLDDDAGSLPRENLTVFAPSVLPACPALRPLRLREAAAA